MFNKSDKKPNYNLTVSACYMGYCVQAIIINFAPLLFLTFQNQYQITLTQITFIITINFGIQLLVDMLSSLFIDKIGFRATAIMAHSLATLGLILMTFLPEILPSPYIGLLVSIGISAVGGGLLEVVISPAVEACPTENKKGAMSLLHSFYCWGCVAVIGLSTIFFAVWGTQNWRILAWVFAGFSLANCIFFTYVPLRKLPPEKSGKYLSFPDLLKNKYFWIFMLLMFCSGACEQASYQWASAFAEKSLGVSKTVGDVASPLLFALLMGTIRALYSVFSKKLDLTKSMLFCGGLCIVSYLIISLVKVNALSFVGFGLCGISVAIFWCGTFSLASEKITGGGVRMFALLALGGDLGCLAGPSLVGFVSSSVNDDMRIGLLAGAIFPVILVATILILMLVSKKDAKIKAL